VRALPPGAFVDVPLSQHGVMPYRQMGAVAEAGWRPTLNHYTSRLPPWYGLMIGRDRDVTTAEQAAALLGQDRLRGLRYVILHKDEMPPEQLRCSREARSQDGHPWGPAVHEDDRHVVLDLDTAEHEMTLPACWAACRCGTAGTVVARTGPVQLPDDATGVVALVPTLPLRPGHYRATFRVEADQGSGGHFEVG